MTSAKMFTTKVQIQYKHNKGNLNAVLNGALCLCKLFEDNIINLSFASNEKDTSRDNSQEYIPEIGGCGTG